MNRTLSILNISSFCGLLIVNFLAVQMPFFGRSPGDVSDLFPNLLTPDDFTFKIWSVIYLLLGLFIFDQSKVLFRKGAKLPKELAAIGIYFSLSCLLNFGWLIAWQSLHIGLAFIFIFLLWLALIFINYRLARLGNAHLSHTLPFSCYLAWICIAALANLNVLLIDMGFNFFGFPEEYWTSLLIVIGIGGTLLVLYLNEDIWFTLVLIWAFFGMYMKNSRISPDYNSVVYTSLLAMIILSIAGAWVALKKWNRKPDN